MRTKYAINTKDLRIVIANEETLRQPDYREITEETVLAINEGKILAKYVAAELLFDKQRTLKELKQLRSNINVRKSEFKSELEDECNEDAPEETEDKPVVEQEDPEDGEKADDSPFAPEEKPDPNPVAFTSEELSAKSVPELKMLATTMSIEGAGKMKRDNLIAAISAKAV